MDENLNLELKKIRDFGINHNREVRETIKDRELSKESKHILKELHIDLL